MNVIITCILIGISLSMDTFSLSLVYGMYGISNGNKIILSCIVGMYHFFMPLLGFFFGSMIKRYLLFDEDLFVSIIFLFLGISMLVSVFRDEDIRIFDSIISYFLFGFTVSIDSFTVGIGLSSISKDYLMVSGIFMMISGCFTYMGLILGNRLNSKFGDYSNIIGGILLIVLSIYYLKCKVFLF